MNSQSLVNKLLSLSSNQEYEIIDSVVKKISAESQQPAQIISSKSSNTIEVISSKRPTTTFEMIPEIDEEEELL